jgi:hypothetical protein
VTKRSISVFGGSSEQDVVLRSTEEEGAHKRAKLAGHRALAVGHDGALEARLEGARSVPRIPGFANDASDQSSASRFSMGVPESARRIEASRCPAARVVAASAFLMFCASSSTTTRNGMAASFSWSLLRSA